MPKPLKHPFKSSSGQRSKRAERGAGDVSHSESRCDTDFVVILYGIHSQLSLTPLGHSMWTSLASVSKSHVNNTTQRANLRIVHKPNLKSVWRRTGTPYRLTCFPSLLVLPPAVTVMAIYFYFLENRTITRKDSVKRGFLPGQPLVLWSCKQPILIAGYIQACRGLMIAAVSLGFFGSIIALFGMKCTKVGGSEKAKAKIACLAGIVFVLSGKQ